MVCPGVDELEQYLSGDATESSVLVRQHVETCTECKTVLTGLKKNRLVEPLVRTVLAAAMEEPRGSLEGTTIGRYRIIGEIGRGGTSIVYLAEQETPRRRVALKLLSSLHALDRRYDRLLVREAQALARLNHPGIACIYEAGQTEDDRAFFAMELVEGPSLKTYAIRGKLSRDERLELFADVCEAIAYAHQRGINHRDLKPSNILVDKDGSPKVLDFGLAKILESPGDDSSGAPVSAVSAVGRLAGTVPYMSPE